MTKGEKKEIFLSIIENCFEDKSGEINHDNCIGFYHHFLNDLEFELRFSPEYGPNFHRFLLSIIELLSHFDKHLKSKSNKALMLSGKDGMIEFVHNLSKNNQKEQFQEFYAVLNDVYTMSKRNFLI